MNYTTEQQQTVIRRLLQYEFMIISGEMCLGMCDWCSSFAMNTNFGCNAQKCPAYNGSSCVGNPQRIHAYDGDIKSAKLRLAQLLKGCKKLDVPCGGL